MADAVHMYFEVVHNACLHGVNALLIGAAPKLDALLATIRNLAESPIPVCALPGRLSLPDAGSVILRDVAALTRHQQQALLDWMDERRRHVQIISASTERLFAQVKTGLFSDPLYYRLNLVLVHL